MMGDRKTIRENPTEILIHKSEVRAIAGHLPFGYIRLRVAMLPAGDLRIMMVSYRTRPMLFRRACVVSYRPNTSEYK